MTEAEIATVRAAVHDELREARSLTKNGDTFISWLFTKVLTIDRLIWIVMLIYALGSKTTILSENAERAINVAAEAAQQTASVKADVEALGEVLMQHQQDTLASLSKPRPPTPTEARLEDRIQLTVTRGELREMIQREVLPLLRRIDQKVGP